MTEINIIKNVTWYQIVRIDGFNDCKVHIMYPELSVPRHDK